MRVRDSFGALLLALFATLTLFGTGCGSHGASLNTALVPSDGPATAPAGPDAASLFAGLPELPSGANDPLQPRAAAAGTFDNIETGNQAIASSNNGVFVNGTGLDEGPAGAKKCAWAMWRWGAFQDIAGVPNKPITLKTDVTITGTSQYWVLLSNYSKKKWQVFGPSKQAAGLFPYPTGEFRSASPSLNSYVVLIVTDSSKMTVKTLNIVANADATPPGVPTGLNATAITPHGATLKWTAPVDGNPDHYELYYSTTATDFDVADGTPESLSIPGAAPPQFVVNDRDPQQTYHFRIRAVDDAGNTSPLSNTCTFTTKPNGPPVAAFTYSPTDVQKNVDITFDPSTSTDPDDPPTALWAVWDWENDGLDDETDPPGLAPAHHSFPNKGPVTVKLSVYDSPTDFTSTTQSFTVGQQIEDRLTGYALGGDPAQVAAADVEQSTGRIAAVLLGAGTQRLLYYNGTTWNNPGLDLSALTIYTMCDVALAPSGKIDILVSYQDPNTKHQNWIVYQTDGTAAPTQLATQLVPDVSGAPQQSFGTAKLAVASNGRITVAISTSQNPASLGDPFRFYLSVMHQKSDGTFQTVTSWSAQPFNSYFAVERKDDTSYCAYTKLTLNAATSHWDEDLHVYHLPVTDAGGSSTNSQSYAGNALQLISEKDPADNSHMFWALRCDNNKLYYGDNFGSANGGGQNYTPSRAPRTLLGVGVSADNKELFYWSDMDANDETWIRGYDAATSSLFEPLHGAGLCDAGYGGWYNNGASDGLYTVTTEARDGEVTGYQFNGATVTQTDTIAKPVSGASVGDKSQIFQTNGGGFVVLNKQQSPTALMHSSATVGGPLTDSLLGLDTYANPDCAAGGTVAGDIILGAIYNSADLCLYRFPAGAQTGTFLATYTGVISSNAGDVGLAYNPTINKTMVAYTQNGAKNIVARLWDGASWSAPTTVYTGATIVNELILKARPDGQWGVAWDDGGSNVRMAETSGGVWQAANTLSSVGLNLGVGSIGMEYDSSNNAGLAVERQSGTTGLYYGSKLFGQNTATWTLASASQGFNIESINMHFMLGTQPTIIFHDSNAGVRMASFNGTWTVTNLAFFVSGSPLVSLIDAAGTVAIAGKDTSTGQSCICFISQ